MRKCKNCGCMIAGKCAKGSGYNYFHVKKGSLGIWIWSKKEGDCNNPQPMEETQ